MRLSKKEHLQFQKKGPFHFRKKARFSFTQIVGGRWERGDNCPIGPIAINILQFLLARGNGKNTRYNWLGCTCSGCITAYWCSVQATSGSTQVSINIWSIIIPACMHGQQIISCFGTYFIFDNFHIHARDQLTSIIIRMYVSQLK